MTSRPWPDSSCKTHSRFVRSFLVIFWRSTSETCLHLRLEFSSSSFITHARTRWNFHLWGTDGDDCPAPLSPEPSQLNIEPYPKPGPTLNPKTQSVEQFSKSHVTLWAWTECAHQMLTMRSPYGCFSLCFLQVVDVPLLRHWRKVGDPHWKRPWGRTSHHFLLLFIWTKTPRQLFCAVRLRYVLGTLFWRFLNSSAPLRKRALIAQQQQKFPWRMSKSAVKTWGNRDALGGLSSLLCQNELSSPPATVFSRRSARTQHLHIRFCQSLLFQTSSMKLILLIAVSCLVFHNGKGKNLLFDSWTQADSSSVWRKPPQTFTDGQKLRLSRYLTLSPRLMWMIKKGYFNQYSSCNLLLGLLLWSGDVSLSRGCLEVVLEHEGDSGFNHDTRLPVSVFTYRSPLNLFIEKKHIRRNNPIDFMLLSSPHRSLNR